MNIFNKIRNSNFMKAMRGEEYNTFSNSSSNSSNNSSNNSSKDKFNKEIMIIPDFEDPAIISKFNAHINDFDYSTRNTEANKESVDKIVSIFFDNIHNVEFKTVLKDKLKYKTFEFNLSSYSSLCEVKIKLSGEDNYSHTLNKTQIAKVKFLISFKMEQHEKKRNAKLHELLDISVPLYSTRLKGGILKITEEEVFNSLLETHPQHFI